MPETRPNHRGSASGAESEVLTTSLRWVGGIVAVLTVFVGVGGVVALGFHPRHVVANVIVLVTVAMMEGLIRAGRARLAAHVLMFVLWAIISVWLFRVAGSRSPIVHTYFPMIVINAVMLSRRVGLAYAAMSAVVLAVLHLFEANGFAPQDPFTSPLRFVVAAAALVMTGGVIHLAARLREEVAARAVASEAQYAELVRTAPEGILTVDPQGLVRTANPAAGRMFGTEPGRLVGRAVGDLLTSDVAEPPSPGQATLRGPDGTSREVEIDVAELSDGRRISVRDVTERNEAERERTRLTERLHQSQKLESIGLLAGGVAHDFNNLVTVILGNVDRLAPLQGGGQREEILREIEGAAQRAADLTRQLLAFGRRQVLRPQDVSVNEVVEGLGGMLRRLLAEDTELRLDLRSRGIVRADAGQLEQVVLNLAVNARDAMPAGGVLRIATSDVERPRTGDLPAGRFVALVVEDSGSGMPPDVVARVFEPFYTTKATGEGTGLGLAVVDGIVRQSGGVVSIDSAVGLGTRFEVLLPAVDSPAHMAAVRSDAGGSAPRGGTVLVIEDEPALRRVLQSALEADGFEVITAGDGREALERLMGGQGPLDVVITDVVMPRMGGPEFADHLARLRPEVPVLFVSGYPERDRRLGEGLGERAFLGKPFRPKELVAAVRALRSSARARALTSRG